MVTLIQLYSSHRVDFKPIDENLDFIQNYVEDVGECVYTKDSKQLKVLLLAILQLKNIEYVDVRSGGEKGELIDFEGNPNIRKGISRRYPIRFHLPSGKVADLGTLTAVANVEGIYERFWRRALILLVTNLLIALFTTVCILVIIQIVLIRHLNKLSSFSRELDLKKLDHSLSLNRKNRKPDELDQMVIAFNDMLKRIRSDVDVIQEAEREIRQRERQYRLLIETMNDGLAVIDEKGILSYVNEKCCEMLGYSKEELIGRPLKEFLDVSERDIFEERFVLKKDGEEKEFYEASFLQKSGEKLYTIVSTTRIHGPNGQFKGSFGIITDITKRRHMERELKKAFLEIKQLKDRLEAENIYLREQVEVKNTYSGIIGQSEAIKFVLSQVEQVAETDSTVLILGETGTGKELIAQTIHNLSTRKGRPMVKVNCAALSSNLIESELFGHEKGAFTGALSKQMGRFEIADKSTIFLDEIGELPLELQSKLLRVLQSGEFERLGSSKTIHVDVRVIAATNRDLVQAIQNKSFRKDLYYRLNVFPIHIPPLRERKEDIPLLVWSFVAEFGKRMGKKIDTIPQKSMQAMINYAWPGNVRELRNVIEHAMIISRGKTLVVELPGIDGISGAETTREGDFLSTLEEVERDHIVSILERTGWRVKGEGGAADVLGVKPSTLYSKMKKLGIRRPGKSDVISTFGR
ncbi:MAG: sigma 54-interacting transcriptional regulator [Deltaproteobacteria bacterium]|nr:sigma 54-interacting transcriptional regulator [Deltaproteobacteria bacterium]